eukprot:756222-Hanusia_phi.AAC.5
MNIHIASTHCPRPPAGPSDLFLHDRPLEMVQLSQGKLYFLCVPVTPSSPLPLLLPHPGCDRISAVLSSVRCLRPLRSCHALPRSPRAAADRRRLTSVLLPALEGAHHVLVGVEDGEGKPPEAARKTHKRKGPMCIEKVVSTCAKEESRKGDKHDSHKEKLSIQRKRGIYTQRDPRCAQALVASSMESQAESPAAEDYSGNEDTSAGVRTRRSCTSEGATSNSKEVGDQLQLHRDPEVD